MFRFGSFSVDGLAFGRCVSVDRWALTGIDPAEFGEVLFWLQRSGVRGVRVGSCVASGRCWFAFQCEARFARWLASSLPLAPGSRSFRFRG
jgi:hypothetical protein